MPSHLAEHIMVTLKHTLTVIKRVGGGLSLARQLKTHDHHQKQQQQQQQQQQHQTNKQTMT